MLFNSLDYIAFFLLIFIFYWLIPVKFKWVLLLISSYFFYISWEPIYILLIVLSTLIDYFLCLYFTGSNDLKKRKIGLYSSVFSNLLILFVFKYFGFFQTTMQDLFALFDIDYAPQKTGLLLPLGISFYTFQTLSYSIDVYRGETTVEKHLGKFALFVSFFPQLIAGPIERAKDLIPQFHSTIKKFNSEQFKDGILLFTWGLCKKIVIADNCAILVDRYYGNSPHETGAAMLFATYLFAIQIYCDFSGYSDMAIGSAKMLGIDLKTNFKTPYFSKSITKFWHRWHISFSQWIRDYIYIPLGGNRGSKSRIYFNLLIAMCIAGFWHGASWNFILWGAINGVLLIIYKVFSNYFTQEFKLLTFLKTVIVFHLICITWVFFRSSDLTQSTQILSQFTSITLNDLYFVFADNRFAPAIIGTLLLLLIEIQIPFQSIEKFRQKSMIWRYSHYIIITVSILFIGSSVGKPFIYFQF